MKDRIIFKVADTKKNWIVKTVWEVCEYICIGLSLFATIFGEFTLALTADYRYLMVGLFCGCITIMMHIAKGWVVNG